MPNKNKAAASSVLASTSKTKPSKAAKGDSISRSEAIELIQNAGGRIYNVTFTKKDGKERVMTCKKKIQRDTDTGQPKKVNLSKMGYLTVYDMFAKDWRAVDTRTISQLKINKKIYKVR